MVKLLPCPPAKHLRSRRRDQRSTPCNWNRLSSPLCRSRRRPGPISHRLDSDSHARGSIDRISGEPGDFSARSPSSQAPRLAMAPATIEPSQKENGTTAAGLVSRDFGSHRDRRVSAFWFSPLDIDAGMRFPKKAFAKTRLREKQS